MERWRRSSWAGGTERVIGPRNKLLSSLGCWASPVNVVWACTWIDNICSWVRRVKVGFYQDTSRLVFRTQLLLAVSLRLTTLIWTKSMPTLCIRYGRNHPYKGGWLKIGSVRRGEMNQNIPTMDYLSCDPTLDALSIEWSKDVVLKW